MRGDDSLYNKNIFEGTLPVSFSMTIIAKFHMINSSLLTGQTA
jgi:hypothetical protein